MFVQSSLILTNDILSNGHRFMAVKVENVNPKVLRECREQIGLSLSDVKKKVPKIAAIEQEEWEPTFKQLNTLAELYKVPRWVFTSASLPEQYQFNRNFSFRKFADDYGEIFSHPEIRRVTAMVERFRNLILELREDMDEPVEPFDPPALESDASVLSVATQVREWLKCAGKDLRFREWKEKLEEKNVFIFTTSKYRSWSHVGERRFRGLAIYHSTLPIIIINNSDTKKAQTFSLFHELGHLLRKKSEIDEWEDNDRNVETWCNELAANVLMPAKEFRSATLGRQVDDLNDVSKIANSFKVSDYACLVRMRQLQIIDFKTYQNLESRLKRFYQEERRKLTESDTSIRRSRPREVLDQYGHIYTRTLFQAYHNQEIGLHKLCKLFDLKRASDALKLEKNI